MAMTFAKPWDRLKLTSGEQVYLERSQVLDTSKLRFFHEDTHGFLPTEPMPSLERIG